MHKKRWFSILSIFAVITLLGCTSDTGIDQTDPDHYPEAKEAAWTFLQEQGWDDTVAGDWQRAEVREVTADQSYELLDETYSGEKALYVGFESKENLTNGTPGILVGPDTNEVMGYMATE